jgi:hypothetical protein
VCTWEWWRVPLSSSPGCMSSLCLASRGSKTSPAAVRCVWFILVEKIDFFRLCFLEV